MKKRVVSILLTAVMAVSLDFGAVAYENAQKDAQETKPEVTDPESTKSPEPAEDVKVEADVSKTE